MHLLTAFRQTGALLDGHFVLRSGQHSRQFFQCARLLQHAGLAAEICGQLAEKVRGSALSFDAIVSPALGGILVGQELARHLQTRHLFTEKQDGRIVMRRFEIQPGERFLVAEDVVTTGSAVRETMAEVISKGGVPVGVACLVDRSGAHPVSFGLPFYSLMQLAVETFSPDALPPDLASTPAVKPGSK